MTQVTPTVKAGDPTRNGLVSAWVTRDADGRVGVGVNAALGTGITARIDVEQWRELCARIAEDIARTEAGHGG